DAAFSPAVFSPVAPLPSAVASDGAATSERIVAFKASAADGSGSCANATPAPSAPIAASERTPSVLGCTRAIAELLSSPRGEPRLTFPRAGKNHSPRRARTRRTILQLYRVFRRAANLSRPVSVRP